MLANCYAAGRLAHRSLLRLGTSATLQDAPFLSRFQDASVTSLLPCLPHGVRTCIHTHTGAGDASSDSRAGSTPWSEHRETRRTWVPGQALAAEAGDEVSGNADHGRSAAAAEGAAGGGPEAASQGPPEMDEVFDALQAMGLQPGRNCVVGDGLALVDVGLYLDGVKVALEMEENRPTASAPSSARGFALKHTMRRVMQAHGWHTVTLAASDWRRLDADQKQHYLAHCINHALGSHGQGGHGHGHGAHSHGGGSCGSGCSDPSHHH